MLRAAEARGPPGGWVVPGSCRHPPGGGGSRSTGREGGTGEASSFSGRRRLAVHLEGGEARGPPGGRVGPGRRRHPPGGGGSRSTGREGRLAVHREGGWDRGGVVILRVAEARGPPGGRVGPGRCHPPGGRGSRSTGREGVTGEVSSSSGRVRLAVNWEGGWDRGGVIILRAAEARGPPGGRGGSRSTGREGGTGEASSSSGRRRLAVHWEGGDQGVVVILQSRAVHRKGGWDLGGVVILRVAEARGPPGGRVGPGRCHPPGGGGSRSSGRKGGTGEVSSSSWRRRLAVHREGGWHRGGVIILLAAEARGPLDREGVILRVAEARGPPGGRVGPGRRRHPPGGGVHREGG